MRAMAAALAAMLLTAVPAAAEEAIYRGTPRECSAAAQNSPGFGPMIIDNGGTTWMEGPTGDMVIVMACPPYAG